MKSRSLLLCLLLTSCVHRPPPPPVKPAPVEVAPPDPLTAIRSGVNELLREQAELFWKVWTTGQDAEVSASYAGREALISIETATLVKEAMSRASGEEQRALHHLWSFLVGEIMARDMAQVSDDAAAAAAGASFSWQGKTVMVRDVVAMLAAEPEAMTRARLARARDDALSKWMGLAKVETAALKKAARKLGYADTLTLASELRASSVDELAAQAEETLASTVGVYGALMNDLARERLGLPLYRVRDRDMPRLFRQSIEAKAFPSAKALENAAAPFVDLGMDPSVQKNLTIDAESRSGKNPRPLAVAVDGPDDVRLSFVPFDGAAEVKGLLHELAAAQYYAHVTHPTMEFHRLGPSSILGTWTQVAESIASDPDWLGERTSLAEDVRKREARIAAALQLHRARQSAARVLYEVKVAKDPSHSVDIWSGIFARAYGRGIDPGEAALGVAEADPLLRSAEDLRTVLLAAQATAFLTRRAGSSAWWKSANNRTWLEETWARGSTRTPEELSAAMGFMMLDAGALVARVPSPDRR